MWLTSSGEGRYRTAVGVCHVLHLSASCYARTKAPCQHTEVQWRHPLGRRSFISPPRFSPLAHAKKGAKVEQRRHHATRGVHAGLNGHLSLCCPPPGLQWPRDVAAMPFLVVRTRRAEKSVDGEREKVVGDPDVLQRGGPERVHCSVAGNGRASHQASWACAWWWCWWCRAPRSCLDRACLVMQAA